MWENQITKFESSGVFVVNSEYISHLYPVFLLFIDFKQVNVVFKDIPLHKKWSFPLRIISANMSKLQETADLFTFTEKILNGNFIFCAVFNTGIQIKFIIWLNPFRANGLILYLLKTPENKRFAVVFRGYKTGTLARNGLRYPSLLHLDLADLIFVWFPLIFWRTLQLLSLHKNEGFQ